ncbi:MAG: c-type cytochrome [Elusimicrobia bacterium]|nr:c-type cytochrome [Elusimicrobiota bacterium]
MIKERLRAAGTRSLVLAAAALTFLAAGWLLHRGPSSAARSSDGGRPAPLAGLDLSRRIYFQPLPADMPGSSGDRLSLVGLGRKLFFERGLSVNGTQSCNDCHRLDGPATGADGQAVSKGAAGLPGQRNSPTVLNAGFQTVQFWDGRAQDLAAQAQGPLLNPVEMAMPSPGAVQGRLSDLGYAPLFAEAFPGSDRPLTFRNAVAAIAAFENTLVTPARFDRWLKGSERSLTATERRGFKRFMDTGCVDCHSGFLVGGRIMEKVGVFHPYPGSRDPGLGAVTGRKEDLQVFKVPSLRNVTLTAPYFHDGREPSLVEAVRLMAWIQLDTSLTADEAGEIAAFLASLEREPRSF